MSINLSDNENVGYGEGEGEGSESIASRVESTAAELASATAPSVSEKNSNDVPEFIITKQIRDAQSIEDLDSIDLANIKLSTEQLKILAKKREDLGLLNPVSDLYPPLTASNIKEDVSLLPQGTAKGREATATEMDAAFSLNSGNNSQDVEVPPAKDADIKNPETPEQTEEKKTNPNEITSDKPTTNSHTSEPDLINETVNSSDVTTESTETSQTAQVSSNDQAVEKNDNDKSALDQGSTQILEKLNELAKGNIPFSIEVAKLAAELKGIKSTADRLTAIQDFIGRHSDELQTEADKTNLRLNKARGISQGFDSENPDGYDGPSLSALITEDPGNEKGIRDAAVTGMVQDLKFKSKEAAEKIINGLLGKNIIDQDTANRVRSTIREAARSEADRLIERFTSGQIELKDLVDRAKALGYEEGSEFFELINASKRDFEDTSERFGTLLSGQNRTDVNKIPYDIFYGRDKTPEELAKMSDKERSDRAVMREGVINQIIEKTLEGLPEPSKSIQREKLLNQSKLNEANRIAVAAEGVALQKEAKAKDFNAFWKKAGLISKYFGPAFLGLGIGGLIALTGNINGAYKLIPLLVGVGVPGVIGGGKYLFGGGLKEWRNIEAEKARAIAGLAAVEPKILAMQGNLAASQEATLGSIAEMAVQAQITKTGRIVDKRAYDQMLRRAYGLIGYNPESAGRSTKGLFNLAIA